MMAKEDYKLVFSGEQSASVMAYLYTSVANGNSQDCSKQDYNFSIRRGCGPEATTCQFTQRCPLELRTWARELVET